MRVALQAAQTLPLGHYRVLLGSLAPCSSFPKYAASAGRKAQHYAQGTADVRHWWPIIADVFTSPTVASLTVKFADSIPRFEEVFMSSLSMQNIIFLHGSFLGQTILPRTYRAKRDAAPFDDDRALRRVLTVRGRAGAMLGMCAMASEKAEDACMALSEMLPADRLGKVQLLSSDCASTKLSAELKCMMPNLQCLVLDPIHVLIVYEQLDSTWSYKTQVLDVTVKLASLGSPLTYAQVCGTAEIKHQELCSSAKSCTNSTWWTQVSLLSTGVIFTEATIAVNLAASRKQMRRTYIENQKTGVSLKRWLRWPRFPTRTWIAQ